MFFELIYANFIENCVTSAPILQITSPAKFDAWNPSEIVVNALRHHVDKGDIQTVVTILAILSDEIRSELINPTRPWHLTLREMEQWWDSYLGLLSKFKLWSCSTMVIHYKYSIILKNIYELH